MPGKKETLKFLKGSRLKTTGLYGSEKSVVQKQTARYTGLVNAYCRQFGAGDLGLFSTPGRTEIGGNHTDHNHGRVLAGAVGLDAVAVGGEEGHTHGFF